jgi:hypothetical protein
MYRVTASTYILSDLTLRQVVLYDMIEMKVMKIIKQGNKAYSMKKINDQYVMLKMRDELAILDLTTFALHTAVKCDGQVHTFSDSLQVV